MAKVLVVDDDADSREAVVACFIKVGHSARGVSGSRLAMAALSSELPDAILLDVRMPGMDGIGLLGVIRSYLRWATIPVAILTAYPEDPRLWHVAQKGVDRVFHKSRVSLAELIAWVDGRACRETPRQAPPPPRLGA
jgi:CheY-like chemotaxis protein